VGLEKAEKQDSLKANNGIWINIAGMELHLGVEILTHNDPTPALPKGGGDDTGNSTLKENFPSPSGRVREGLSF